MDGGFVFRVPINFIDKYMVLRSKQIGIGRQKFGFTMVEMLVVITVIVVMMGISVPAYVGMRKGLRDNQRIEDMKKIQIQMEAVKTNSLGKYSGWGGSIDDSYCCLALYSPSALNNNKPAYPAAPTDPLTSCSTGKVESWMASCSVNNSGSPPLCYNYQCWGRGYCVCAKMEVDNSGNSTNNGCDYDGAASKNYYCVSNLQ